MRQAVGPAYPVFLRISGKDFIPGSNGLEEAMAFAREAEAAGIDLLNVTGGWHETTVPQLPPGDLPRAASAIWPPGSKSAVQIPWPPATASTTRPWPRAAGPGGADLIGMGRALLADPELPKGPGGRVSIRPCVACNQGCLVGAFFDRPLCCLSNGLGGRESPH